MAPASVAHAHVIVKECMDSQSHAHSISKLIFLLLLTGYPPYLFIMYNYTSTTFSSIIQHALVVFIDSVVISLVVVTDAIERE